jgi:hypothetical protein
LLHAMVYTTGVQRFVRIENMEPNYAVVEAVSPWGHFVSNVDI